MKTVQSEVAKIQSLLLKHPRDAFQSQELIMAQWRQLRYLGPPELDRAIEEYESFIQLLSNFVPRIHFLPRESSLTLDSIYVRDASIVCKKGVILCNMGKPERAQEPGAQEKFFRSLGITIVGRIEAPGTLEGGDVVWLNDHTLAVGRSYRTNSEGIGQLKALLEGCIEEMIIVDLPHWRGPKDVFHLMSIISPVDHDTALVYSPLMPIGFREKLLAMGYKLLDVPDEEFETLGCNVLAIEPGKCLMLSGNPKTRELLQRQGMEVYEYKGEEISIKGGGGPTCLTRPIERIQES